MSLRKLNEKDRKVLRLILSGKSANACARQLNLPTRTAYNIVTKLCSAGYLTHVLGTDSPKIYEAGPRFIEEQNRGIGKDAVGGAKPTLTNTVPPLFL